MWILSPQRLPFRHPGMAWEFFGCWSGNLLLRGSVWQLFFCFRFEETFCQIGGRFYELRMLEPRLNAKMRR